MWRIGIVALLAVGWLVPAASHSASREDSLPRIGAAPEFSLTTQEGKRRFLEEAIRLRAQQSGAAGDADVWAETLGAWRRRESAPATIRRIRKRFRQSFQRHHRRP